ncbi:fusaric acid resistance -like family protein [Collimonas fungivorans]|uniref:Fusaric acid resistance-like family protein n=1 Tax=Collimonas fungivorans TaxID=158899 RepID=A0A127PCF7_9BURK|nr:FUSC family protein [Collimonas fungivorans]AMO95284.1 fusaric acid resistance -like family protein [Collimonas fungivorans]
MLAAIATLLCALAIDPEPGPAVLAVVLCISLSRSQLDRDRRGRIEAAIVLPAVGLVAVGVGALLRLAPWIGALVFIAGMFLSIWLRRFGPMARRAGSLIALPFVALLSTPYIPATRVSPALAPLMPVVVALLALLWVGALHALARRARFLGPAQMPERQSPAPARTASSLRPMASTRMAIQMAAALAVSFVIGYAFFAERWSWIVLTAFIVNSGSRGRLDVAYKSVLRVLGAAAGTVIALSLSMQIGSHGQIAVAQILVAIFLGVWLRPLGYAWWALFVTIALALLQGFTGSPAPHMLWPRLEEIAIGAVIGVASAWLVLPVRSTAALRRRLADALAALADALDPATAIRTPDKFVAAVADVEQMRPAFNASRFVTRRFQPMQPADWLDTLAACRDPAIALIDKGETPGSVRRAVGAARKSMREPQEILPALQNLHRSMTE